MVPPRSQSKKIQVFGIFPGARVVRGIDWIWMDQDGGAKAEGQVLQIEGWKAETARSVARVHWPQSQVTKEYRLGHKGKVDLQLAQDGATSGGYCYPDHLPVAGKPVVVNFTEQNLSSQVNHQSFKLSEKVRICVDETNLKRLQEGHGGYSSRMATLIGRVGKVHRITNGGDIRVQYPMQPEAEHRWTVNPAALERVTEFGTGDMVEVSGDESKVRDLQAGHGGWDDTIRMVLGQVAKVLMQYKDGDLRIEYRGMSWTMNSSCVRKVEGVDSEPVNPGHQPKPSSPHHPLIVAAAKGEETLVKTMLNEDNLDEETVIKALQISTKQNRRQVVGLVCQHFPSLVDGKYKDKSPLMIAVHVGHLDIVDLLLSCGAKIETCDDDGDNAIHFAALGKQSTVLKFLLERSDCIDLANKRGQTALHVAVSAR